MNRSVGVSSTRNQTAVTSRILRIVFYYSPLCNYTLHFFCPDHPLRPEHLPHRMRKVKHLTARG